jgi:hypothetical protein
MTSAQSRVQMRQRREKFRRLETPSWRLTAWNRRTSSGPAIADSSSMRPTLVISLMLSSASLAWAQETRQSTRARVIAALETLMITGEPRHTSHDEGQWLQTEVNAAIAAGDAEITQLAQRAAIPLIAVAPTPVSSLGFNTPVMMETPAILTLPMAVAYRAHLFASVDGGELIPAGTVSSDGKNGSLDWSLLESAKKAGLHHIRLRAHIVYERSTLSAETRDLPEIVYAIYDPKEDARFDARFYEASAKSVSARRLDATLPDVPFATWLHDLAARYGDGRTNDGEQWRVTYCDEFFVEAGLPPRRRDLCTVAYFQLPSGWGEIWLRTGRIELTDNEVRWLAEGPTLEGIRLRHSNCSEVSDGLAALPTLLATPPSSWPSPDLSVAPEDIAVTRTASTAHITAIIRNSGSADSHGALFMIGAAANATDRGISRSFVVDVPRGETKQIELSVPFAAPYGAVLAQVLQISEHSPHDTWTPDPTPDDTVAIRIISSERAPKGFAASLLQQCAPVCRGF